MVYTVADRVMDFCDDVHRGIRGWFKSDASQYFPIVCPHNANALALMNGSLMSVIRIDGYMGQYFPVQFSSLRDEWGKFLQTSSRDKSAKGFDLFWSYEFDPEGMRDHARSYREDMIKAAERRGFDLRDIIEEEADLYGSICANEQQYLMIVTHIDSLLPAERKGALKARAKDMQKSVRGASGMPQQRGIKALDALHEQHVNKVSVFLEHAGLGYTFQRLDCYDALWAMRYSFKPDTTGPGWQARLTMNDCRFRPTDEVPQSYKKAQGTARPVDWSFMLPPQLNEQMVPDGAINLGPYAVVGDRTYAPMYVSELAVDPRPLEDVLQMCYKRKLPIRMVYSIMANSEQANYWNRAFASVFSWASASNRQISKADKGMTAYMQNQGSVFGYGVSITTWAKTTVLYGPAGEAMYDTETIQKRARDVETFVQQWGGQQLDNMFGDSLKSVMDASPGYSIPPSCPKAPQIEMDIISQLPIMRPARLWSAHHAIWLRTSEGVLAPYQPFTNRQNAMLTLVLGGMGFGKSNLMSEHVFHFAAHPDAEEMPYIRGVDFGESASGVVGMIRDQLPPEEKHKVMFSTFTNDGKIVKNMFDTRLGVLRPLEDHRRFLINWLLSLCHDLAKEAGVSNVVNVLSAVVSRVYDLRDPSHHMFESRPFMATTADQLVVEKIAEAGIQIHDYTHYWDVTWALVEHGLASDDKTFLHAASLAQRRAVPQFSDVVKAADQLAPQFVDMPHVGGQILTAAIANAMMGANALFPCFVGITNTDISESRICILDMSDAFGRGTSPYDDWQRSVMFAVVYRLLNEDLFVNRKDSGGEIIRKQAELGVSDALREWHVQYFERQDQVVKLFMADEMHRLGKVTGAFEIIDSMAYEGRKYKVGMLLGTQMPQHFPPDMLKLSSSIFMFGASQSSENAYVLQDLFDLTDDERQAVLDITKPNAEKGAEVFVIHKVDTGIQKLKLHFQMGNIKRWAYATEPVERGLRSILFKKGPSEAWARRILAEHVPSANDAIKRKQSQTGGDMSQQEAIKEIAEDLLKLVS